MVESAEVPDLGEERVRRAVRRWLEEDEQGRALLAELADDPTAGDALRRRLEIVAPAEVRSYLRMSGGNVEKIISVAKAEQLHVHQDSPSRRALLRLFLTPLSTTVPVGGDEPTVVRVRIQNDDVKEKVVELKVGGWFSDLSEIEGGPRLAVPAGGYVDTRVRIAIPTAFAASLPAGSHPFEAQVIATEAERASAWAESAVALEVLPYQAIQGELHPPVAVCEDWKALWVDYSLAVQNSGNEPAEIKVKAHFDAASMMVETAAGSVSLSLGSTRYLPVHARPLRHNLSLGTQTHSFDLQISTQHGGRYEVSGKLSQPTLFTRSRMWKWGFAGAVVVLAVTAFTFPTSSDFQSRPTGPTSGSIDTSRTVASRTTLTTPLSDPSSVVLAFYQAIDQHEYHTAWALLSARKLGMTYEQFKQGFTRTDSVTVADLKANGATVSVRVVANEDHYSRKSTYAMTYTIKDGLIVEGTVDAEHHEAT